MAVKADITIDIDKQVGELQNLSQIYNARVGDDKTPLTIAWRKNDLSLNLKGLHAFIVGKTGDGSYNNETGKIDFPVGSPVSQFEDDGSGTLDGGQSGLTTLLIPKQMWQKSGIFAGYIGLKSEDGSVFTSKDIWFKVLGNVLDAGVEINYFIGDFNKALAEAEKKLQDKEASFDQTTANALQDLHDKYLQKVQQAEDGLNNTNTAIDANLASLKKIAASVGALQAQLDTDNLETQADHKADIDGIKADYDLKLSNIKHPVEAFDSFSQLQAKYPNGKDGDFVTTDTGHIYIFSWATNSWQDCGQYQTTGISDNSINADKLVNYTSRFATYINPLVIDWKNCTIQLLEGYHLIFKGRKSVALPACTFSFKVPDSKGEMNPPSNGVIITFKDLDTAATQKAPETQFKIYDFNSNTSNPGTIPDDEVYVGWLDYSTKRFNFVFPTITNDKIPADNDLNEIALLDRKELTLSANDWVTQNPIQVDFPKPSITIKGFSAVIYKDKFAVIPEGEYILKNHVGDTRYFLYWDYDKQAQKYTIKAVNMPDEVPLTCPYLGWIETNWKKYKFANGQSSNYDISANDWITSDPIEIDFSKPSVTIKGFSEVAYKDKLVTIPNGEYVFNNDGFTRYFLYLDYDDTAKKYTIKSADNSFDVPSTCFYLGWIETEWKKYKFVNGQSSTLDQLYPWANKNISCLGDSITWGMQEGNFGRTISYAHLLPALTYANVTEVGQNASSIGDSDNSVLSFVDRVDNIKDQDLVTVLGGTNDFGRNQPLGTMQNNENDTKTFYGALKYLIIHITNNNPNARVMFMTPPKLTDNIYPHTYDTSGNLVKNSAGFTEADYVNAIKEVCSYYSIPVLDLYNDGPYNPFIPAQRTKYTNDGLHPNQAGQDLLAKTVAKAINNLC